MDFFNTVEGRAFFEHTVPRLCNVIEKLNRNFNKAVLKDSSQYAGLASNKEEIEKTEEILSLQGEDEIFTALIIKKMLDNDSRSVAKLIEDYKRASVKDRYVIDTTFIDLTGESLSALIRQYPDKVKKNLKRKSTTHRLGSDEP